MKIKHIIIISAVLLTPMITFAQESLMLGEVKLEEVQTKIRTDNVEKAWIYSFKYKKNGKYKDSTLQGFKEYSIKGELLRQKLYGGKKNSISQTKKYGYDDKSRVISYDFQVANPKGGVEGRSADFFYSKDRIIKQVISLANILYEYYPDGRLKSKSYHYNNGGSGGSAPWVHLFEYDENKNLIHVADDTTGNLQTSYYNEKNELIRHDYFPGYGISFYEYDERGNCTKQADYEMNKKGDWDSTVFEFNYDLKNRLVEQTISNKKGVMKLDRRWEYNDKDQMVKEVFYKNGKPKLLYRYYFDYFAKEE